MARWLLPAIAFVMLAGCAKEEASPAPTSKLTTAERALVGDWLGQMVVTEERVDDYHKMYPEGDRNAVRQLLDWEASRPVLILRFSEDGTVRILTVDGAQAGPESRWELSKDEGRITVSYESEVTARTEELVDGLPVQRDSTETVTNKMTYIFERGLKGFADEERRTRYYKLGSREARDAFTETREELKSLDLAKEIEAADYVGRWTMSIANALGPADLLKASFGVKEYERARSEIIQYEYRFDFSPNETFAIEVKDQVVQEGTWKFDPGAKAIVLSVHPSDSGKPLIAPGYELRLSEDKSTAYLVGVNSSWSTVLELARVKPKA